jgi:predicted O-methyltransferase YrrM
MSEAKRRLKAAALRVPKLGDLVRERDRLREQTQRLKEQRERSNAEIDRLKGELERFRTWGPPGHFYSPVPAADEVQARASEIFDRTKRALPGIDLREAEQLALLDELKAFYPEMPFTADGSPDMRYRFENRYYSYSDAIFLYSVIRHLQPKRIIEVGSGYSSCVILDTNERFFDGAIACTFIEPYPDVLRSLLKPGDEDANEIIQAPVQDVDPERLGELEAGDILLIDSTHVSKTGSDVNRLFFEVLPRLRPGVWVHVHDIFYPFEYPEGWVAEGRAWNEDYLLRAFLTFSSGFEIALFNTYLEAFHEDWFRREMPLCLKNPGGSIWLRRV